MVVNNQCDYAVYAEAAQETPSNSNLSFDNVYCDILYDDDINNASNEYRHLYDDQFKYTNPNTGVTYWYKITHLGTAVDEGALNLNASDANSLPISETCCAVEHVLTVYYYVFSTDSTEIAVPLQNAEMRELGSCKYGYVYSYDDRGNKISYFKKISNRVAVPPEVFGSTDINYGSDINFLYNLGKTIVNNVSSFEDIINFDIGGHSFFSLLFTSGFLIYAAWAVTKWILPT